LKKILIIQTAFIGDVVLATPLIEKMHGFYPNAKIDFLLRKGNQALLKNHPKLNQILIWNKKTSKYKHLLQLAKKIRQEKYDLIINAQRFFSSGLLCAFSNAQHITGFQKNPLSIFFTKKLPHELNGTHEVERNLSLIEHLTNTDFEMPCLYPSDSDFEKVNQTLLELSLQNAPFITIAPTSVWFTKQLKAEKWIDFLNRFDTTKVAFLIGGPSDFEACEAIKNQTIHPNIYNLAGKLHLLQSAVLMKKATMNYANDSAPIHIASAMNAPMTAVFCSTAPKFGFTPLSDNSKILETTENLSCKPCGIHGKKACPKGHFKCSNVYVE
jgi:lipopolysaccharide heptosyltransferase II